MKKRPGCVAIALISLVFVALFVVGVVLGVVQKRTEMPVISLAAENIPLPFTIPGFEHGIPNTLPSTWLTMIILIVMGLAYNRAVKKDGPPSRFQVAIESFVDVMLDFMKGAVGEKATLFFPLVATFFLFIAVSNWCGILPGFGSIGVWAVHHAEETVAAEEGGHGEEAVDAHAEEEEVDAHGEEVVAEHGEDEEHHEELILVPFFRSANAHLSTTLALALVSVVAAQYFGLKSLGISYLSKYINFRASSPKPDPSQKGIQAIVSKVARIVEVIVNGGVGLLEMILEVLKVLPFSFRLFGNIFAGEVLLFVVSYLFVFVFPIIFLGLELFVGLIQGLIFSMLTLVFFSIATTSHHGEEH
ncbi:MAG: F0F1 ATP synthase subunit A [Chloroflexi bacterium]|nr:F0F1 ATP synthase subunit A [Chloroflexota bacterium]